MGRLVTTSSRVTSILGLCAACFVAGNIALVMVMGVGMFANTWQVVAWAIAVLAAGSVLCYVIGRRSPGLWFLWPLFFGVPMFAFGWYAGFSPPDPAAYRFWRTLGAAFVIVPGVMALYGRMKGRGGRS
jgi:hypothetical protein